MIKSLNSSRKMKRNTAAACYTSLSERLQEKLNDFCSKEKQRHRE